MTKSSYTRILKSSSIMGGAAGINILLGMLRVKFAAVLIGAAGVGLNASFSTIQGLVGTLAGLGIQSSAVREIAAAVAKGDEQAIGRTVLTLRRICWLTGLAGMTALMLFSPLLSALTFNHSGYTLDIAALGLVILFGNLSGGQLALIQGMRRIGDMARANIIGAVFGTVAAIGFYTTLGLRGIVPTLLAVSTFQLLMSWRFARELPVPKVELTLRQTFTEANDMVRLGLVFMANGLMGSVVAYATVALITHYEGEQAVGLYSAAFALSGMFVNFVLSAMGADYYPRLTAESDNKAGMTKLVNEQTQIGVLLAFPGVLATFVFSPFIIELAYSKEFLPATPVMLIFLMGTLARVIAWPMGYVVVALGKRFLYFILELVLLGLQLFISFSLLPKYGLVGVAWGFFITATLNVFIELYISNLLIRFEYCTATIKIMSFLLLPLLAVFVLIYSFSRDLVYTIGLLIVIYTALFCMKNIAIRAHGSKLYYALEKNSYLKFFFKFVPSV